MTELRFKRMCKVVASKMLIAAVIGATVLGTFGYAVADTAEALPTPTTTATAEASPTATAEASPTDTAEALPTPTTTATATLEIE